MHCHRWCILFFVVCTFGMNPGINRIAPSLPGQYNDHNTEYIGKKMQLMKRNKTLALLPEECVAQFQETVNSMGGERMEEIYQDAYRCYLEK